MICLNSQSNCCNTQRVQLSCFVLDEIDNDWDEDTNDDIEASQEKASDDKTSDDYQEVHPST